MRAQCFIIIFLNFLAQAANAQRVVLSEEFNLKNDFFYEIVGNLDDNIFLYRDKGFRQEVYILNENLQIIDGVEIELEKRKCDIVAAFGYADIFHLVYAFRDGGDQIIKMNRYDSRARLVKEDTLDIRDFPIVNTRYRYTLSKDRSQLLVFKIEFEDKLDMISFNLPKSEINYALRHDFGDSGMRRDFRKMVLTNQGHAIVFVEKDNSRMRRKKHSLIVHKFRSSEDITAISMDFEEFLSSDFNVNYDENNGNIVIGGLYWTTTESLSEGYYFCKIKDFGGEHVFTFNAFDEAFIESVETSGIFKRKKGLDNFEVKEILLRNDGGALLMTEMCNEIARRSTYSGRGGPAIRYVDYFNEDIAMIAVNPDGSEHWKTILHKKQFSQDDDAIYSSFFSFKTPSSLRIIYNDEIRSDNTVSEYIINPLGTIERKNVLNTQNQRLKLRFQDAIQISSTSLLVPSERGNRLLLVKVKYDSEI